MNKFDKELILYISNMINVCGKTKELLIYIS